MLGILHAVHIFRDPEERVQVAQAALSVFHIGLDEIARIARALDARLALGELGLHEFGRGALHHLLAKAILHVVEQRAVADEEARLQQSRADRHVVARLAQAFLDGARGMADLQLQIPEKIEHRLDGALDPGGLFRRQQEEEVDVRARRERSASIAAHSRHPEALAGGRIVDPVEMARDEMMRAGDRRIHHRGEAARAGEPVALLAEMRPRLLRALRQQRAEGFENRRARALNGVAVGDDGVDRQTHAGFAGWRGVARLMESDGRHGCPRGDKPPYRAADTATQQSRERNNLLFLPPRKD